MLGFEILAIVLFLLLVAVAAVVPRSSSKSTFELQRLEKKGNENAKLQLKRDRLLQDVVSMQRIANSLLLVAFVTSCLAAFGWATGTIVSVLGALAYGSVARAPFVRKHVSRMYNDHENSVLRFVDSHQKIVWWLRSVAPEIAESAINSKAELEHLVENAHGVLSDDEKKVIIHSLTFDTRLVKDVMTPRSMVRTLKKTEMLGPLVLDDLHKSGHSRFPVINGDIDHVVGTLYLRDVLTLDTSRKHTSTAETAMDKKVFYIKEDQSLAHALSAFLKTHHHLFIVVNEFRETVGILSLEDTMEALLGRKIIDEFDAHEDLRAVAARSPQANRAGDHTKDV